LENLEDWRVEKKREKERIGNLKERNWSYDKNCEKKTEKISRREEG